MGQKNPIGKKTRRQKNTIEYVYKIAWKSIMHGKWGKKTRKGKNPRFWLIDNWTQLLSAKFSIF